MASIQKRGTKWRAVVRIKGYPTVSKSFDRKQEAQDWAYETEREIKRGRFKFHLHNKLYTFDELILRYIEDGVLEHQRSQEDTLRHLNYWKDRFHSRALVHINRDLLSEERKYLLNTPTKQNKPRSPATVNRYFASLSALFTYAHKTLNWISENPCQNLKKLKESRGRDRVLSDSEITCLLLACQKSKCSYLYPIVLIALTTGARKGEILKLKWQDLNTENRIAFIRESKNGKPRSIPLSESVIDALKTLPRHPHNPLVFASKTAFGKFDIKKPWKKAVQAAKIEGVVFHDLRHTFCTLAAAEGASNLELATATGHSTLQMLQRYTHLNARATQKYTDSISDKLKNKP